MKRFLAIAALLLPLCAQAAPGVRQAALAIPVAPAAYPYPGAAALINMFTAPKNAFNNAIWVKTVIQDSTFATKTLAPDGTQTASKMVEGTTANSFHVISQKITRSTAPAAGVPFRISVDAKQGGRNQFFIQVYDNAQTMGVFASFDLRTGTGTSTAPSASGGYTLLGTSITPIGNGFFRCTVDFSPGSDPILFTQIVLDNNSGTGQYTGDGASGIYIWQISMLPRTVWNLKRQTFFDDFTYVSPDKGNTQGPGFNWYVGNWPAAIHDPGDAWRTYTVLTGADLSVSSSILTIATNRSGLVGWGIGTAAASGAGRAFGAPALFRCSMSWNPANQLLADNSWPVCWGISLEFLNGAATNNISAGVSEFIENDFYEGEPTANAVISDNLSTLDWTITGSGSAIANNGNTNFNRTSVWPFTQATWNSGQHVLSGLWLSAVSNGGIGLRHTYVDGIFISGSEVTWSSGAGLLPGGTPSNPSGTYTIGDNQHLPLIINAGPSIPVAVDFADVWQQ